jgi:5-methylcytosine-specific restriction endonuclease McrA
LRGFFLSSCAAEHVAEQSLSTWPTVRRNIYESDDPTCTPVVRTAGQGYLDTGDHAHIARNETGTVAQNVVTYFAPPGATLRIDQPSPGNCAF